jgi:transposase
MGRPTKLTPEIAVIILDAIESGNFLATASRLAGVSYKTFKEWMSRGRSEDHANAEYRAFRAAVRRARAKAEADSVGVVKRSDTWSAHAWYLERSFQKRWARQEPTPREAVALEDISDAVCGEEKAAQTEGDAG